MSIAISRRESEKTLRLSLSGDLTIEESALLHDQLRAAVDANSSLLIDAREVTFLDTSIVQVLLVASHRFGVCRVESRSSAWDRALVLLGVHLGGRNP